MIIIIILIQLLLLLLIIIIIWYHTMIPYRCGGHLSLSLGLHIQCVDPSGKLPTIALHVQCVDPSGKLPTIALHIKCVDPSQWQATSYPQLPYHKLKNYLVKIQQKFSLFTNLKNLILAVKLFMQFPVYFFLGSSSNCNIFCFFLLTIYWHYNLP